MATEHTAVSGASEVHFVEAMLAGSPWSYDARY